MSGGTTRQQANDVAPTKPNEDGRWECPDCEQDFSERYNLTRHMGSVHDYVSPRAPRPSENDDEAEGGSGRAELRQTVLTPLRTRMRSIDRRLEKLTAEIAELRAERRDIEFVLKRLDPTSFVASSNGAKAKRLGSRSPDSERKTLIRRFIVEHQDELSAGFTPTKVHDMMQANGMKGVASPVTVRAAIEEMRDAGLVRADRIGQGGGMNFLFVGNGPVGGE